MKKYLYSFYLSISRVFLTSYQRDFINENKKFINKNKKNNKNKFKKVFMIQAYWNYYYLLLFKYFIFKKKINSDYKIIAIWPTFLKSHRKKRSFFFSLLSNYYYELIKRKWILLYKSIGVEEIFDLNEEKETKKNLRKTNKIFKNIKNKSDILQLKYNNINIGDLVYDTVLRFNFRATIDIKHYYLKFIIFETISFIDLIKKINKTYDIKYFYTSYSVYLNHGIPVRYLLFNSKAKIYSFGNPLFVDKKILSKNDYMHTVSYKNFKRNFLKVKDRNKRLLIANKQLKKKFKGMDDLSTRNNFVPKNTFKSKKIKIKNLDKINGVLFLHDFFDSPHLWGDLIFSDLYEWTITTLNEIRSKKLPIGIKSHPNSRPESLKINAILQERYSDLFWIDKDLSNLTIFKSKKIKYGISCFGTVLYEMAYYNKVVISAGSNPTMSFNYAIKPKNVSEYLWYLNNLKTLKPKKNQKKDVEKNYYMYFVDRYFFNNDQDINYLNKIDLIKLLYDDLGNIKFFNEQINQKIINNANN